MTTGRTECSLWGIAPSVGICFSLAFLACTLAGVAKAQDDWLAVGGDRGGMRYSTLSQVNTENVAQLELAWEYKTGELKAGQARIMECTPLVVDGMMYLTTGKLKLIALDAASGEERWRYDPFQNGPAQHPLASGGVNRGCAYWPGIEASEGEAVPPRILHGTSDGRLHCLDAKTGEPIEEFGQGGVKDLREDLQVDIDQMGYGPTSAPAIFENLVIVGFSCGEGPGPAAPGDIRAFDVRTGEQAWRFHTVPRDGEFGNETWEGESWRGRGAANAWGGFSVDKQLGYVYAGLGSAAFDFYGGDRKGENLFANCTIALDARTGQRVWHFQTLHHDLWDHDLPTYPNLVTVTHNGTERNAVAQVTKTGYVFLFDRDTGEPLFEVQEVPAPASEVAGEHAWPTQPIPTKPPAFCRTEMTRDDATDIAAANRKYVQEQFDLLTTGSQFTPPSLKGTVVVPGFHGGATWSGASFDPETGLLYVNSNNQPNVVTLVEQPAGATSRYRITGYNKFLDQDGYPAIKPPWGQLSAIDLNQGKIVWQTVLGEYPELTAQGIPQTGTENFGGTIVTAGGLVFIGATRDEKFHAFDKSSGELLWEYSLPAGGYATPSTYSVDGRQYVVIPASGGGKLRTRVADSIMAFALPE
ncbi:MAG: pyrroloquinoline quinone-dependent dehydrogenase [Planctomycetota bacterium]